MVVARLRNNLEIPVDFEGRQLPVGVSIVVAGNILPTTNCHANAAL